MKMSPENELQLFIQFTKNRKGLEELETILDDSFLTLIKKLDSKLDIIDESFSINTV